MHFKMLKKDFLILLTVGLISISGGAQANRINRLKISKLALSSILILNNFFHPSQAVDDLCCLCDDCDPPLEDRYDLLVDNAGNTCIDILFEMADTTNDSTHGSNECAEMQDKYYQTCCDPNYTPKTYTQAPTPEIEYVGPFEPCEVCLDGSFPGNPAMVIAALYWDGVKSCRQLYYHGKRGDFIQNHECDAVQWFVQEPCGCNNKPTNSPTPRPTRGETKPPQRKTPPAKTMTSIGGSSGRGGAGGVGRIRGGMR